MALLVEADIILSIVPPRDALATARRIAEVRKSAASKRQLKKGSMAQEIVFIDLNAISPKTVAKISDLLNTKKAIPPPPAPSLARRLTRTLSISGASEDNEPEIAPISVKVIDGGIIGSPPKKSKSDEDGAEETWSKPSIPLSGQWEALLDADFMSLLNMRFISQKLGTASALKSCFASLTKGFTALSTMSYATAATCGVLPELQKHLDLVVPGLRQRAENGMIAMPPKAYRWVDEMREIGQTFRSSGGFQSGGKLFDEVAEMYRFVAEDTVLGDERVGKRKRGQTAEDVAEAIEEGIQSKMQKREGKEAKLDLAWRGSWGL